MRIRINCIYYNKDRGCTNRFSGRKDCNPENCKYKSTTKSKR